MGSGSGAAVHSARVKQQGDGSTPPTIRISIADVPRRVASKEIPAPTCQLREATSSCARRPRPRRSVRCEPLICLAQTCQVERRHLGAAMARNLAGRAIAFGSRRRDHRPLSTPSHPRASFEMHPFQLRVRLRERRAFHAATPMILPSGMRPLGQARPHDRANTRSLAAPCAPCYTSARRVLPVARIAPCSLDEEAQSWQPEAGSVRSRSS